MEARDYFWILFIIIIIIIVALIIIAVISIGTSNSVRKHGSPWNLQKNGASTVNMNTGGHNWLINQAAGSIITITSNSEYITGQEIKITNTAPTIITIDTSQLLSYIDGTLSQGKNISPGSTAVFVFTDTNRLLRTD